MQRKITKSPARVVSDFKIDDRYIKRGANMYDWLKALSNKLNLQYLLSHSYDGVNWGKFSDNSLKISADIYPDRFPPLRFETLQEVRLFGEHAELFIWFDPASEGGFQARLIEDSKKENCDFLEAIDEAQMLWGNLIEDVHEGFTLLREGQEGKHHAVPFTIENEYPDVRLTVRHYIQQTTIGFNRIVLSRLVGFSEGSK